MPVKLNVRKLASTRLVAGSNSPSVNLLRDIKKAAHGRLFCIWRTGYYGLSWVKIGRKVFVPWCELNACCLAFTAGFDCRDAEYGGAKGQEYEGLG